MRLFHEFQGFRLRDKPRLTRKPYWTSMACYKLKGSNEAKQLRPRKQRSKRRQVLQRADRRRTVQPVGQCASTGLRRRGQIITWTLLPFLVSQCRKEQKLVKPLFCLDVNRDGHCTWHRRSRRRDVKGSKGLRFSNQFQRQHRSTVDALIDRG